MRGAVLLLDVRMEFVFASSITMEMDITVHVSYKFKEKKTRSNPLLSLLQTVRELVLQQSKRFVVVSYFL